MASGAGGSTSGNTSTSSSSSSGTGTLAKDDSKWYFTAEQLANSPSRKCGMDADQELMYRQRAANLIQDMGQRLQVSQLCINTAIVYMHRFYAFHSFTQFHRNNIAAAALFLAAKVEEQPRKLEHIIKVVHICLQMDAPDPLKETYVEQAQDLVFNENVLLQTLGFDVAIDHPHTHVVKTCHLVKASKDLAQTSYFMASNSLHLTTMCLQYRPTVVACFCIHLACKWSRWEIPQSNEGRHWFHYVDKTVTLELLKQLTDEFLHIFDRCPTRLKSKMKSMRADQSGDDPSRRSTSSSSGMPGPSSSIARGIDDGSSSSSSHHRSSSHSHSHSKQSSSSGDPMLKASQPSSSNHKIPSTSNSSRSRGDRPSSSSSSQQQLHQQQIMTSSGHYSSSGTSGKMQPIQHHSSSRSSIPTQSSSSSSSSSRTGYMHDSARDPKNRMIQNVSSGSSASMTMNPYVPGKLERHSTNSSSSSSGSSQKTQSLTHMDSKSSIKSQSSTMASLYNSSSQEIPSRSSSSSMMKQPQTAYGSHPPSYSQTMSARTGSISSSESVSVPNQQSQFKQLSSSSESSFRLIDDNNRLADPMQMCTPPKQSKPSSIFSPDWKDTQSDSSNLAPPNASTSSSGGKSRSHAVNVSSNPTKPIKESPSSREKKPILPPYADQQHHKQRSETPKKERRVEPGTAPSSSHQQKLMDKKSTSSNTSSSLKRSLEQTMAQPPSVTSDPTDLLGITKISSVPSKRSLPSSEQIRKDEGTDFRESKVRKVEPSSPTDHLFASTFDLSITFDKQDDVFSSFSFNDPGSLLSQPLLSDSKPFSSSAKGNFSSTINGIETNPALVSSLLKESLCSNDSKFGTLSSTNSNTTVAGNASIVTTTNSATSGTTTSLSSAAPTNTASSSSVLNSLSATSISSAVPETIKTEAPSPVDVNAPSTISSLLSQTAPSLGLVTSVPANVPAVSTTVAPTTVPSSHVATVSASDMPTLISDMLTVPSKDEEHQRSKSEKKKKKEKHKHKEKDKSKDKDREDKKKHKKDKDRHRDRDREKSEATGDPSLQCPPHGPIKIKLPKDKLNLPSLSEGSASGNPTPSDTGLKIKIPKDRLSGSSSLAGSSSGSTASGAAAPANYQPQPPNPLKLKISKDKIEHYNISAGGDSNFNNGAGHGHSSSSGTSGHHSHSSKKKDRDKERDKSKSSKSSTSTSSHDYKQNGSGSATSSGGQTGNSSSKSSSSKLNVPAVQPQYPLYSANSVLPTQSGSITHHPASFDYMQHAQAPTLQQQQQYFSQFGTFNTQQQQQQQQQLLVNNSAMKVPGTNPGPTLPTNPALITMAPAIKEQQL